MNRYEKALFHINKDGHGVEIGPCHDPIAAKRDGYKVHVIDHMSRKELLVKYKEANLPNLETIEEVDFVWHGETYVELKGKASTMTGFWPRMSLSMRPIL